MERAGNRVGPGSGDLVGGGGAGRAVGRSGPGGQHLMDEPLAQVLGPNCGSEQDCGSELQLAMIETQIETEGLSHKSDRDQRSLPQISPTN